MLKPLPADMVLNQQTQQRRSRADYALGRLHEATAGLSDRSVLVRPTQHREIQSMLAFRGVTVTSRELASVDLPDRAVALRPPYNVARYVTVMGQAARDVHATPVSEILTRVACALARSPGQAVAVAGLPWRTTAQWFGHSPQDAYWWAVAPGADLRAETNRLFDWLDTPADIPLADKIARGTFELFTLAPFTNTADLLHILITLLLIKNQVVQDQIVPTAVHIDRNRDRFAQLHQYVVRTGDFNHWVQFFADGLTEQCDNQLRITHQLAQLPSKYQTKVEAAKYRHGLTRLLAALPSFQIVTAPLIADKCDITSKHARDLLAKAEVHEIVEQVENRRKNRIYDVTDVRRALDLYTGMIPESDRAVTENRTCTLPHLAG